MVLARYTVYKYSIAMLVAKITVERLAPDMLVLLVASQPHTIALQQGSKWCLNSATLMYM